MSPKQLLIVTELMPGVIDITREFDYIEMKFEDQVTVHICDNGDKYWFLNGKFHREDGPAVEYANGDKTWFLNDARVTEAEHTHRTQKPMPSVEPACADKTTAIDSQLATISSRLWLACKRICASA